MPLEIERKFLVTGQAWRTPDGVLYRQGYLNRDKTRTVRVRIAGDRAFLTIKGVSTGATRVEFEYEIPVGEAAQLLTLCDGPLIEKTRHRVTVGAHVWEVDEFHGDNDGLVVAEIELGSEDEAFERPEWVTVEVTEDARYYNSNLAVKPFSTWGAS
ncbi:MAG TPA: CYTH domain-containing protein [Fluviicoccus sp.]|nr:CYTH domain-containing protein [Fluviicoccus sp.]